MKFSEFLSNYFIDDSSYIVGYNAEADVNIKIPILTLIGILSNITGTGTENMGAKWSGPQTLTDSSFFDNGNLVKTLHGTTTKGLYLDFANSTYKLGNGGNNGLVILPSSKATFSSSVTATEFIKLGGLSTEFLKADGTVDTNAYQKEITLTTIGSTGPATLIGDVLNIPDYASTLGTVLSVNDQLPDLSGNVSLTTTNIPQGTNLYYTDSLARLSLSSIATGLTYTNTTGVFSLTAGYAIPTTTEITNWNNIVESAVVSVNNQTPDIDGNVSLTTTNVPQGTNLYYTDSKARLSISSSATGLTYTSETGIFSLTAGYAIPTTTEITTWNDMVAGGVTIATDQTITGVKTFTKDILFGTASIGRGLTPANNNLVFGIGAGANITQAETIAIGRASMGNSTGGYLNIGIGLNTLYYATGSYNIALGGLAMQQTTTGEKNLAMGYQALFQNTIGNENFALGFFTLNANTSGSSNIGIGANSVLTQNTIGSSNIAIGSSSMTTNISGNLNVGIGISSLSSNTIGSGNVAIGAYALRLNSTGDSNVGIGQYAGWNNSTGIRNTSIGEGAGYSAVSANPNYGVHIGFNSGYINSGSANTSLGYSSGRESSGSNNIFIGYASGYNASSGSYNVVIGSYNLPLSSQSNTLAITDGQSNVKIYSPDTHNIILGGTTDNGLAKLQVTGAIYAATIANTTTDTNKYLVSDGGVVKYITGTQLLAFIGGGVGTVTSVDMSVPTGLSISGNPITTTGTLALTYTAGYSIPTNTSQTNWDTAYTNRITSLTTTGASGSATLISNTLNVPTYTLAGLGGVPSSSISGTSGYIAKFGASNTLGDSIISDNGSIVTVGGGITANGDITVNNLNDIVFYDTTLSAVKALINNNQLFIGTSSGTKDPGFTNFQLTNSAVSGLTDSSFAVNDQSMSMSTFVNSAASEPRMETEKARGTFLVPLPLLDGDTIGGVHIRALGASGYKNSFMIRSTAVGAESSGAFPTETKLYNRKLGSTGGTIPELVLTIDKYNIIRSSSAFQPGRLTTTERNALTGLVGGEIIYNTTVSSLQEYSGGVWSNISSGGTVTSVDMSVPTGLSISGNPITSSGTLALTYTAGYAIPTTSSQTNWDTAYTNRITSLTTTGSSGSATLIANTLNIPTYTLAGLGGISLTSLSSTATGLTYSNTTGVFSLTSGYVIPTTTEETNWNTAYTNRITSLTTTGTSGAATLIGNTLNIPNYAITSGTVTSVDMTVPTGLSISGNPITSSGTFALTYTAGYSIPTDASQTNWDTAYTNRITSLTTTGSSGAATLISNVLNIPNYTLSSLGGVPYTGAVANVDLGEYQLMAGQLALDLTPTGTAGVGIMRWNDTDGTIDFQLKGGNVTLQVGQEIVARVVNKSGANLLEANYQVVKVSDAQGQRLAVDLAQADNDANSADTLGIVTETINNNQEGFITILGNVNEINTTGSLQGETWVDGDILYLSATTAGEITNIKPAAPQHLVVVGYVIYAHAIHGKIYTKVQNGYELDELHNVLITTPLNNQVLGYESSTSLWKNASIATWLGYTPYNAASVSGTSGTIPLFGASNTLGNSLITQSGSNITTTGNSVITGNLTVDTNTLFVDSVNNRVGIGTISPLSGMMHYYGAAGASAVRWSEAATTVGFVGGAQGLVTGKNGSFMVRGESGLVLSGVGNGNNLFIDSTGDIQTNSATDTGEHFIIGGSGRINGTATITGAVTGSSTAQFTKIGIGNAPSATSFIFSNVNPTGATSVSAWRGIFSASNDITSRLNGVSIAVGTQASTTISDIVAYNAEGTSFGVGSSATRVTGFTADSSLANALATNVYGFQGSIASGTNRWNLYMGGTASNYLAGNTLIGSATAVTGAKLEVTGTASISSTLAVTGVTTTSANIIINGLATGTNTFLQLKNNSSSILLVGSDASISGGAAADIGFYTYGANNLDFWANSSRIVRFAGDGKVGIGTGTTAPATKVDVKNGTINSSATWGFGLGITAALPNGVGVWYHSDGTTAGHTKFGSNLGGLRLIVEGNTNVLDFVKTTGAATFSSSVTATSFIKSGGTSAQYLMADGTTSTISGSSIITGTGTTNYHAKFTSSGVIGSSVLSDDGSYIYNNAIPFYLTGANSLRIIGAAGSPTYIKLDTTANVGGKLWRFGHTGAIAGYGSFDFYNETDGTVPLTIASDGSIITNSAANTGEKFIIGGSARVNGSLKATSGEFTTTISTTSNAGSSGSLQFLYAANANSRTWRVANDLTAYGDFAIQQSTTQTGSTFADILAFSNTGAATFISNVDINGTTLNLGNNTIVDSYTGNSSTYRVLVLTDGTANTNIGLNYNPIANVGGGFNGTGQIFIAHNKGILASNAAGDNYIGVLRPIGTGVYFGGSLSSGELAGDGLFIATSGAATFSSTVSVQDLLSTTVGNGISAGGTSFAITPSATRGVININGSTDQFLTFSTQSYIYNGTTFRMLSTSDIDFVAGGVQRLLISASTGAATFSSSVTAVSLSLTTGNFTLGTSSNAGVVNMYNASTVPSASITNGVILYAQDVDPGTGASSELKVRDEAGNITTLSPHNFSLIPNGPSEELAWSYYSEKKGKKINVDMLKLARLVESLTDEQLVFIQ